MSYPVNNQSSSANVQESWEDQAGFSYDDDDYNMEMEDSGGDSFENSATSTVPELQTRVTQVIAQIQASDTLSRTQKQELIRELNQAKNQLNYAISLTGENAEAIKEKASDLCSSAENTLYGGSGDSGLGVDLENPDDSSKDADENESEFSASELQSQRDDLRKKVEGLHSDGKISDELYDTLNAKLDDASGKIKSDPNGASEELTDFTDTLSQIDELYAQDGGEAVEKKEIDGLAPAEASVDILDKLEALLGDTIKEKDVLKALAKHFPDLDKNGDGSVSRSELQKAIQNKDWPSINGPDQPMLEFVYDIDKEFKSHFDQSSNDGYQSWKQADSRLVKILQTLYPDKADGIKVADYNSDARSFCNFWFDGDLYSFANKLWYSVGPDNFMANSQYPENSLCITKWYQDSDASWRPAGT